MVDRYFCFAITYKFKGIKFRYLPHDFRLFIFCQEKQLSKHRYFDRFPKLGHNLKSLI